ncbi:carbohydrate ABC transporter permease [Vallitalea pronyensis]|uniref:Carbohydrate ABC transporter permease n=1 Tax=Vallitalea pronyensis TaxID=1348613 RepID=A0A8J8MIW8_9FIRM|nr:carbohydrate ABC transporter permease [Vallitalea pronyensis]QUI22113.1 carbohydrate ABC transporter permease [Vallitalea pronyensis]
MLVKSKESKGDRIFRIVNFILLTLFFLAVLYPILYVVSASFSSAEAVISGKVFLWPVGFTLKGYQTILQHHGVWTGYANSIFYAGVGTSINVVFTILAAYPLSRKSFRFRNFFMFVLTFTMIFSGGLIPTYLLVTKLFHHTRWALLIPGALSVYNVIITRTFFQNSIPEEILESAQLDGCNDFQFVWRIVLPLSKSIIAVITLFYVVGHWNEYFSAMLYLKDTKLYPLQLVLRQILVENQTDESMFTDIENMIEKQNLQELLKYALMIVSSIPVLIIYPFVQKHFVKGVMVGSLKG